jgi:hypothetical protein
VHAPHLDPFTSVLKPREKFSFTMVTYSDLPFDIIHHLCSIVWALAEGKSLLMALSLVDNQTRAACIPFLFMEVKRGAKEVDWDGCEPGLNALLANEAIRRAIKYAILQIVYNCVLISLSGACISHHRYADQRLALSLPYYSIFCFLYAISHNYIST